MEVSKKWGIVDLQFPVFREETYLSKEKATKQFRKYWTTLAVDDFLDNADYKSLKKQFGIPLDKELTGEEERELVKRDFDEMTNEQFFDFFEFKVKEINS